MADFEFTPKTCEEYVVNRINELERHCNHLSADNIRLLGKAAMLEIKLDKLREYFSLGEDTSGDPIIQFRSIYKHFDPKDYDDLYEIIFAEEKNGEPEEPEETTE